MPDLELLRDLAAQVRPPALAALEEVAARRRRRAAISTSLAGVVAVVAVVAGLVFVGDRGDRSLPEPVISPTPSVTPSGSPEPSPEPSPTPSATHRSEASMSPEEVVGDDGARLMLTGVSADDPDFRLSVWVAECAWCPDSVEPVGPPRFFGLALTTDGFATATYLRPPFDPGRPLHVESPAPGLLLLIDAANGPEWLVRDDGTITRLSRVVEARRPSDPRFWHLCGDNYGDDYQLSWCALDPPTNRFFVWEGPWRGTTFSSESVASPALTDEPWGLVWIRPDERTAPADTLEAYWYVDGVRRTRSFGPAETSGEVHDLPAGVMGFWSMDRGSRTLSVFSSSDGGDSWQTAKLSVPFRSRALTLSRTPAGGLLLLEDDAFYGDGSAHEGEGLRLWRAPSLDGGPVTRVYETRSRTDARGSYGSRFTEAGGRIWSGGLWSDDDGRTWSTVPAWR